MRGNTLLARMLRANGGAAGAEFALVLPLLMTMLFGFFELGRYMEQMHVVSKAVRDGARYASRQPWEEIGCDGGTLNPDMVDRVQSIVRTGTIGGTSQPGRINGWDAADEDSTIEVTRVDCDTTGTYQGIYTGLAGGVPVIQVAVRVPYNSLFGSLVFEDALLLNASEQAAVMGL